VRLQGLLCCPPYGRAPFVFWPLSRLRAFNAAVTSSVQNTATTSTAFMTIGSFQYGLQIMIGYSFRGSVSTSSDTHLVCFRNALLLTVVRGTERLVVVYR
jgi:hypothetical protein